MRLAWGMLFVALTSFTSSSQAENDTFVMGAVGDSISVAVNASGWGALPEQSWSTGSSASGEVNSHFKQLKDHVGVSVQRYNVAQGGATSASLQQQLDPLLKVKPDYVTVLIGANDVCSWRDSYDSKIAAYLERMRAALQRLIKANPEVKVYLGPLPNLYSVWKVGKQKGCQWFWDFTNICSGMFHSSRTEEQRQELLTIIRKTNEGLQALAQEFPEHVKFNLALFEVPIEAAHISTSDCFHPSIAGQNMIAEKTWETGWYTP
jgi:lysophospholipase L1-like esterase